MNLLHLQVRIEIGKLLHFLRHQGISGMIGLLPAFKHPKKCEVRLRPCCSFFPRPARCAAWSGWQWTSVRPSFLCWSRYPGTQVPMVDGSHGEYANTTLKNWVKIGLNMNFIGKLMQHIMIFGVHESMSPSNPGSWVFTISDPLHLCTELLNMLIAPAYTIRPSRCLFKMSLKIYGY